MPPGIPIADWWFTLEAAVVSEVAWTAAPVVQYRIHGSGRSAGRQGLGGVPRLGPFQRDVQFKLEAVRILDLERFTPAELVTIWEGAEGSASTVMQSSGTHFAPVTALVEVDTETAAELSAQADAALARGDRALEARLILAALAWDPYLPGGRRRLHEAAGAAERLYAGPDPLAGARPVVLVADAEELLADEAMLSAYAEAMTGNTTATLAIDATRIADEDKALLSRGPGGAHRTGRSLGRGPAGRTGSPRRGSAGASAHGRRGLLPPVPADPGGGQRERRIHSCLAAGDAAVRCNYSCVSRSPARIWRDRSSASRMQSSISM